MTWQPEAAIQPELEEGEVVRWTGQPSYAAVAPAKAAIVLFGLVFAGFGVTFATEASSDNTALVFKLFPLIFVAAGLAIAGSAVIDLLATSRTAYAVTSHRVLVVKETVFGRRVQSYGPALLNALERREHPDGSGTLTFRHEIEKTADGTSTTNIAFRGVQNVRGAAHAIQLLQGSPR